MEDIDVNWEIVSSNNNFILVEYKHTGIPKCTSGITLYGDDVNNVAAIIQAKGPYHYFYTALHAANPGDVANLVGQTGTAVLHKA